MIPGLGRFPEEGNGNPLQYSCLEDPINRGAWSATVLGSQELDTTEQLTHIHIPDLDIPRNLSKQSTWKGLCLVTLDSLQPHGLLPARLLCPWHFPGKNTGVGCHFPLHGIILTQGSNLCLLNWQADSLPLSHQGSP